MSSSVICIGNLSVSLVTSVNNWPGPNTSQEGHGYQLSLEHGIAGRVLGFAGDGHHVHLVSRIGHDDFGDLILAAFRRAGVNTTFVKRMHNCQTPCNVRLVMPDGETSEVSYPNAHSVSNVHPLVGVEEVEAAQALFINASKVIVDQQITDDALKLVRKYARAHAVQCENMDAFVPTRTDGPVAQI